jgi:threonine/homoserine/homoserine lactone efflux protein
MLDNVQHLGWFVVAGVLLNLTPGPDLLYILSHALRRQAGAARAGVLATLGIISGCLVHVVVAAVGLGALIAASATAYGVLKWLGALYLVYLGWRSWRASAQASGPVVGVATQLRLPNGATVFWRGVLTNLLNPKVVLFFLAFLPQFIAPGATHQTLAFLLLGVVFSVNSLLVCLLFAFGGAWLGRRLGGLQRLWPWLDRCAAVLFLGFGLKLVLSEPPGR